jgi:hypothetical protein
MKRILGIYEPASTTVTITAIVVSNHSHLIYKQIRQKGPRSPQTVPPAQYLSASPDGSVPVAKPKGPGQVPPNPVSTPPTPPTHTPTTRTTARQRQGSASPLQIAVMSSQSPPLLTSLTSPLITKNQIHQIRSFYYYTITPSQRNSKPNQSPRTHDEFAPPVTRRKARRPNRRGTLRARNGEG